MTVDPHSEEGKIIRQLIPLSTLPINQFNSLCNLITVEHADPNTFLFKRNDITNDLIYLIDGSITLQANDLKVATIKSDTESARFALAHQLPRKIDAFTNNSIRFLRLNINIINALPSGISYEEENTDMIIDEPEQDGSDDDWMTTLLKSPIFRALPPANLQQLLMSLEEVTFEKGESIIKQGDTGDYYYLIKKGQCLLSRKPSANAKEITLGKLQAQDTFGEDSLLSGEPRNVSITALTYITLLRLNKEKFISLIKKPALKFITHADIQDEMNKGAILFDVRTPDEYKKHHLPHSLNVPFFTMRMQLKSFDNKKNIIVICENGKTSEAAAFLLLRHKFTALIVEGGMEKEPQETLDTPAEEANAEKPANNDQVELLQQENQALKQTIQTLKQEKEGLEKNYRALYKQTEKLKSILDKIRNDARES
ncbi:MAG: cyclic nucleotide-binding domain-containing protein [Methylococcales bacterium]|nr:cyclic nucleotide-binding domain-containing protein [Methylococcales bacterium]